MVNAVQCTNLYATTPFGSLSCSELRAHDTQISKQPAGESELNAEQSHLPELHSVSTVDNDLYRIRTIDGILTCELATELVPRDSAIVAKLYRIADSTLKSQAHSIIKFLNLVEKATNHSGLTEWPHHSVQPRWHNGHIRLNLPKPVPQITNVEQPTEQAEQPEEQLEEQPSQHVTDNWGLITLLDEYNHVFFSKVVYWTGNRGEWHSTVAFLQLLQNTAVWHRNPTIESQYSINPNITAENLATIMNTIFHHMNSKLERKLTAAHLQDMAPSIPEADTTTKGNCAMELLTIAYMICYRFQPLLKPRGTNEELLHLWNEEGVIPLLEKDVATHQTLTNQPKNNKRSADSESEMLQSTEFAAHQPPLKRPRTNQSSISIADPSDDFNRNHGFHPGCSMDSSINHATYFRPEPGNVADFRSGDESSMDVQHLPNTIDTQHQGVVRENIMSHSVSSASFVPASIIEKRASFMSELDNPTLSSEKTLSVLRRWTQVEEEYIYGSSTDTWDSSRSPMDPSIIPAAADDGPPPDNMGICCNLFPEISEMDDEMLYSQDGSKWQH